MDHAGVPVLFVRRGTRPGALAPSGDIQLSSRGRLSEREPGSTAGADQRPEAPRGPGTLA